MCAPLSAVNGRDGLACGKPLRRWDWGDHQGNPGNGIVGESVSLTVVIHSDPRQTALR